jgi:hypothetical protein
VKPAITFTIAPTRDRKAPFRYRLSGRVKLPKGSGSSACKTDARVTLRVTRPPKGKVVASRNQVLSDTCTFGFRLSFAKRPGSGRLRAVVTYAGNDALLPARSRPRSLRAG